MDLDARFQERWLPRAITFIVLFGAAYVGLALTLSIARWHEAFSRPSLLRQLPLVLALVFVGDAIRGMRWFYYGRRLHWRVPMVPSLTAFGASFALTATPGKAGELLKSALLYRHYRIPVSQSAGVLVVERLGDLVSVFLIVLTGITQFTGTANYVIASALLIVVLGLCLANRRLHQVAFTALRRVPRLEHLIAALERLFAAVRDLLRPLPLAVGLVLGIAAWSIEGTALFVLLQSFGFSVPLTTAFAVFGIGTIAGALVMTPGGIGGVEATMIFLLGATGIAPAEAAVAVALFRFCTLWFGSVLGVGFAFAWIRRVAPPEVAPAV